MSFVPENTPAGAPAADPAPAGVAYYRVASQGPSDQRAIAEQREAVGHKAAELGVPITEECLDIGVSGKRLDRPGLLRVLELVRAGQVTHCIVDHGYRLARTIADAIAIERELRRHGVRIIAVDESTDPMQSMIDAIASEDERQRLAALEDPR